MLSDTATIIIQTWEENKLTGRWNKILLLQHKILYDKPCGCME